MSNRDPKTLEKENVDLRRQLLRTTTALKVAEATRPKNAKPTVEIDGKHYVVRAGVRHQGQVIKRDQLANNKKLCKELIAQGAGMLQEVNTK